MKLLADVNIPPRVVSLLRAAGHEAVRVGEVLDVRATDAAILAEAGRTGAVVVSQDQDFSALLAVGGETSPSLLNLRCSVVDAETLAGVIHRVLAHVAEELRIGAIVTIDDGGVRVRRLPIG